MTSLPALTLVLALFSLSSATTWATWNQSPVVVTAFNSKVPPVHSPNLPFLRLPQFQWGTDRRNQYSFTFLFICNVVCGPRSYLVPDPWMQGRYLCERDQDPSFWGSPALSGHSHYCIPNYDGELCSMFVRSQANQCKGPDGGVDCCYHNEVAGASVTDLVDETVSTSLTALRLSEGA